MADKPDLFSRLFRKTQDHKKSLEQKEKPVTPGKPPVQGPTGQGAAGKPATPATKTPDNGPAKIKTSLSGSKLDLYQTCPKKFYFTHIRRLQRPAGASPQGRSEAECVRERTAARICTAVHSPAELPFGIPAGMGYICGSLSSLHKLFHGNKQRHAPATPDYGSGI